MGTHIEKLSALQVARAAKGTEKKVVSDGGNLYLRVSPRGAAWIFRYRLSPKKLREMGLGPFHTVSLAEAREKARECRKLRLEGLDPIEERQRQRMQAKLAAAKTMSFRRTAEAFIEANRAAWKNRVHAAQWSKTLEAFVFPLIGDLPVEAIDTGLVLKVLEPIWTEKTETASRVRGRIESILNYAKVKELRHGENPARWRGHLDNILPKRSSVRVVEHHAALPYAEIGGLMDELRQVDGVAARALEFTILTAARAGEVIGARWSEIKKAERLWIVPKERMKKSAQSAREHRVPLSDRAMEIIEQMAAAPEKSNLVFSGRYGRPLAQTTLLVALNRLRRDCTTHGMRSTFRDWVSERTNFPAEMAELALAHSVGSKVEQAYRRGDQFERRRELMQSWAHFCAERAPKGELIPLRAAQ